MMVFYALFVLPVIAINLNTDSDDSIKSAAKTISKGLMSYYQGEEYGKTVGIFPPPYYWWQSGGAWGSMLDYWWFTGDEQYNQLLKNALLSQVGDNWDYIPINQSSTEGNDDQAFWGFVAMAAAERNFSNPTPDKPQWLHLAQAVFNSMTKRWDTANCGGGLRWQIFQWNSGYDYKNAVSNGGLFHIAARLARYTSNHTYVDWANTIWDWMEQTSLINGTGNHLFVFDGFHNTDNCSKLVKLQWTYNAGLMMSGSAYLYNYTEDSVWETRAHKLLDGIGVFFENGIMSEEACEPSKSCNNDQRSFKAYLSRFLGLTAHLMEDTREQIDLYLISSAIAAAQSCSGGSDGVTCGQHWRETGWDGFYGLGEQMSALEVIQNLRYGDCPPPFTQSSGGSSQGDAAAAGEPARNRDEAPISGPVTKGDRVGVSFITIAFSLLIILLMLCVVLP